LVSPVFDNPDNDNKQHIWVYDILHNRSIKKEMGIKEVYVNMQSSEKQIKNGENNIYFKD
jgi:hypothetical protein